MSTPHVVDDELVEALAEEFCRRRPQGRVHSLLDGYPCKACTLDAREFIAHHRLVRLPKEADGWVPCSTHGTPLWRFAGRTVGEDDRFARPIYLGNPIDATTDHSQPTQKDGEG